MPKFIGLTTNQYDMEDKGTPVLVFIGPGLDQPPTRIAPYDSSDPQSVEMAKQWDDFLMGAGKDWTIGQMGMSLGGIQNEEGSPDDAAVGDSPKRSSRMKRRVAQRDSAPGDADVVLKADGKIAKTDDDQRVVFGWAYVTHDKDGRVNVDKSGDFVDEVGEIEKAAYDYVLKSRQSDADHTNVKGGEMVESIVFTPEKIEKMGIPPGVVPNGWWVGFKIEDEDTWQRVKKGELAAFSIHGSGTRTKAE